MLLVVVANVVPDNGDQTPSGTNEVLEDDFSDESWGWTGHGGSYDNGVYRIDLEAGEPGVGQQYSVPLDQGGAYPVAAKNLRISVDARTHAALDANSGYGVVCRWDKKANIGYIFAIGDGKIAISKRVGESTKLREVNITIDPTAENHIQAECTNDNADQIVHLVFKVNGQRIEASDTGDAGGPPLLEGTVGIVAGTGGGIPIEAEFDNVVVEPI